jgi:hypothetical protein
MSYPINILFAAAAIVIAFLAIFGLAFCVATLVKVWKINKDEYDEASRLQGEFRNALTGKLKEFPNKHGDFRIVRGLAWNAKTKRYEPHGALSSEAFRSAFPF